MTVACTAETERLDGALSQLRASIRRLSSSPVEQYAWLKEIGTYPLLDELALEFDDVFQLAGELASVGRLSRDAFQAITAIDRALSELSDGPEANWLPDALESDQRWATVRELATQASSCMG